MFSYAEKLFSAEIWKMPGCHFWANAMLIEPRVLASRASPGQKWPGLRVFCSKNFSRATFFVFGSTQMVDICLSYLPVKQIWWKSAVWYCHESWIYDFFSRNLFIFHSLEGCKVSFSVVVCYHKRKFYLVKKQNK